MFCKPQEIGIGFQNSSQKGYCPSQEKKTLLHLVGGGWVVELKHRQAFSFLHACSFLTVHSIVQPLGQPGRFECNKASVVDLIGSAQVSPTVITSRENVTHGSLVKRNTTDLGFESCAHVYLISLWAKFQRTRFGGFMNTIMSVQLDFIAKHRLIFSLTLGSFNYIKGQRERNGNGGRSVI